MYILKHPAIILVGAFVAVPVSLLLLGIMVFIYLQTRDPIPEDCEYEKYHNQYCVREGDL